MTTIERIQAKYLSLLEEIAAAEKAAEMLKEILEAEGVEFEGNADAPAVEKPARKKKAAAPSSNGSSDTVERIKEHLKANGPTRLKDIAEALGLTEPGVGYSLKNHTDVFVRSDPDNRLSPWQLAE
jgi:hypothetical protein